jgi:hypothetical protein
LHNIVYSEYRLQKNGKIKWSMSFLQKWNRVPYAFVLHVS